MSCRRGDQHGIGDRGSAVFEVDAVAGIAINRAAVCDCAAGAAFEFERSGISPRGKVLGRFQGNGVTPVCVERLKAYGIHLPPSIFNEVHEVRER